MSNTQNKTLLGSFGSAVKEAEKVQEDVKVFEFYGEEIEIANVSGILPFMKLASVHEAGETASEQEAMAAMYETLQNVLTESSFQKFYKAALRNRVGQDILVEVLSLVFTGVSDGNRPLEQDSSSLVGQPPTGKPTKQKSSNKSTKHSKQLSEAKSRQERKAALAAQLAELENEEEETPENPLDAPLTPVSEFTQLDWAEIKGASVMGAGK